MSLTEDYKLHLFLFKEWKRKIDPNQVAKIINAKFGDNFTTPTQVTEYYKRFNNGDTQIFKEYSPLFASFNQLGNPPENLNNFPLLIDDDHFDRKMLTKDGRFLIFPYFCENLQLSFIVMYDLFRGIKTLNPVSFKPYRLNSHIVGQYLFVIDGSIKDHWCKLRVLKINYDDLSVTELLSSHTIDYEFLFNPQIVVDQLDTKRFMLYGQYKFLVGQIFEENEEIFMNDEEKLGPHFSCGRRLIGKKFQDFTFDYDVKSTMKWREIILGVRGKRETNISIDLDIEISGLNRCEALLVYHWAGNNFYAMFQMENRKNNLLMFDTETLKWSDVGVLVNRPESIFIDKNEMLTIQAGKSAKSKAFYRVGLRKPDKLMNLTRLTALKESTLYGNGKYLNAANKIPIVL